MSDKERLDAALFEYSDGAYKQVLLPIKFGASSTTPLFEGNAVSEPVAIIKEGTYHKAIRDWMTGKVKVMTITYSKRDLEAMAANATRDVPLNVDHLKDGPNEFGWVRMKTGTVEVRQDADGKFALFAQVEATPSALQLVEKGRYRDFSPEVSQLEKRIVGLALTNYPVMQQLHQFSEDAPPSASVFEGNTMDEAQVKALEAQVAALQANFSTLQAERDAEKAARIAAEREAKTARLALEFSDKVTKLVKDEDGKSKLPAGLKDAVLQLYLFAAEHEETTLEFSQNDATQQVSPVALLDAVFAGIQAVEVYSQVTPENLEVTPPSVDDEGTFDVEAAKRMARDILSQEGN